MWSVAVWKPLWTLDECFCGIKKQKWKVNEELTWLFKNISLCVSHQKTSAPASACLREFTAVLHIMCFLSIHNQIILNQIHAVLPDRHGYWRLRTRVYTTAMCPVTGWVWAPERLVIWGFLLRFMMFVCFWQDSKCPVSALLAAAALLVLGILLAIAVIERLKYEDRINEALNPHHTPSCCNQTGPAPDQQSRWGHFLFPCFHFLSPSVWVWEQLLFGLWFCWTRAHWELTFSLYSISFSLEIKPTRSEFPIKLSRQKRSLLNVQLITFLTELLNINSDDTYRKKIKIPTNDLI